jgi:DNA-binding GntR family transcriptional regulator
LTVDFAQTDDIKPPLHEAIYQQLRKSLAKGELAPGQNLSLRNLAASYEGSVTPVRDAVWRLTAERALQIGPTRRISVPRLAKNEIRELLRVRALLEPEAAGIAISNISSSTIEKMEIADNAMNQAVIDGDVSKYMATNHDFHFLLYRASGSNVLVPMIEALWIRFGPFMRHAYPDVCGMNGVEDHHAEALEALKRNDEFGLKRAIAADVNDGLKFLLHDLSEV